MPIPKSQPLFIVQRAYIRRLLSQCVLMVVIFGNLTPHVFVNLGVDRIDHRLDVSDSPNSPSESPVWVVAYSSDLTAIPVSKVEIQSRTQVRTFDVEEANIQPRLKGVTITHFQSDDVSYTSSLVTRTHISSLRVIRI